MKNVRAWRNRQKSLTRFISYRISTGDFDSPRYFQRRRKKAVIFATVEFSANLYLALIAIYV